MKVFLIEFPTSQAIVCNYDSLIDARIAAEKANETGEEATGWREISVPTIIFRDVLDEGADIYGQDINCSGVEVGEEE